MQRERTLIIAALLALAALSTEQLAAQEVWRFEVMHNGSWVTLRDQRWVALQESLAAKEGLPEELAAVEDGWPVRISDAAFDLHVFGRTENAALSMKKDLHSRLGHFVDDLTDRYGLTSVQKQKIYLAGRGDIHRLLACAEDLRLLLRSDVIHNDDLAELNWKFERELNTLRPKLRNPFGRGSLIAKTLNNTLTSDQIAAYEKWKHNSIVPVTRNWDLKGEATNSLQQIHLWILDVRGPGRGAGGPAERRSKSKGITIERGLATVGQ